MAARIGLDAEGVPTACRRGTRERTGAASGWPRGGRGHMIVASRAAVADVLVMQASRADDEPGRRKDPRARTSREREYGAGDLRIRWPASAGRSEPRPGGCVAGGAPAGAPGEDRLPLGLAHSAPHAVRFPGGEGMFPARPDYRAACADRLRRRFPRGSGWAAFALGMEEQLGTLTSTGAVELPLPLLRAGAWKSSDVGHRSDPPFRPERLAPRLPGHRSRSPSTGDLEISPGRPAPPPRRGPCRPVGSPRGWDAVDHPPLTDRATGADSRRQRAGRRDQMEPWTSDRRCRRVRITAGHGWCAPRRQSLAYPPPVRVTRTDIEFPRTVATGVRTAGGPPRPVRAPTSVAGAAGGQRRPARVGRAGIAPAGEAGRSAGVGQRVSASEAAEASYTPSAKPRAYSQLT